jgi:hypothetical protein
VVARAVQALVVAGRNRSQAGQGLRAREHALDVVGMQPNPLALGVGQRSGLVPDRVRHPGPPQVVHKRSAPQLRHRVGG